MAPEFPYLIFFNLVSIIGVTHKLKGDNNKTGQDTLVSCELLFAFSFFLFFLFG